MAGKSGSDPCRIRMLFWEPTEFIYYSSVLSHDGHCTQTTLVENLLFQVQEEQRQFPSWLKTARGYWKHYNGLWHTYKPSAMRIWNASTGSGTAGLPHLFFFLSYSFLFVRCSSSLFAMMQVSFTLTMTLSFIRQALLLPYNHTQATLHAWSRPDGSATHAKAWRYDSSSYGHTTFKVWPFELAWTLSMNSCFPPVGMDTVFGPQPLAASMNIQ